MLIVVSAVFLAFVLTVVMVQRSRRHGRYQAKLDAAFERAQVVRVQRPQGLYGERAWTTQSSRARGMSQITLLNLR